ncbi:TonB family protein [Pseudoxanthomonas gei]|uniref:TonB family protein n=1 Tax=Pseudoxanthomonas gei TaxID=1383030 RepID=A0ABX0AEB2_9GAMM|nr:energy transducer TonB [Pseudoxanthomonas gei]NDK37508.1 TonB family protein [Pseudoxanthomonas gei]
MSTPNPNEPGYNRVDPDAPVVAPPRSSTALVWILLLVALVSLGLWWYSRQTSVVPPPAPAATETPVIADDTASAPAVRADRPAAVKPQAKPKPTPAVTRDPSPLASNQQPKYPGQALRSGVEGSVSVRIEVDATGTPTDVKVVERSGERSRDLDRAVLDAARKWRFEPAMKNGKAVAGAVILPVEFKSE